MILSQNWREEKFAIIYWSKEVTGIVDSDDFDFEGWDLIQVGKRH